MMYLPPATKLRFCVFAGVCDSVNRGACVVTQGVCMVLGGVCGFFAGYGFFSPGGMHGFFEGCLRGFLQ